MSAVKLTTQFELLNSSKNEKGDVIVGFQTDLLPRFVINPPLDPHYQNNSTGQKKNTIILFILYNEMGQYSYGHMREKRTINLIPL